MEDLQIFLVTKRANIKEEKIVFFFSLDMYEIYYKNGEFFSIYCSLSYGPYFGLGDLQISDNCNKNYNSFSNLNIYNSKGSNILLAGSKHFSVLDYIVYQIEIG